MSVPLPRVGCLYAQQCGERTAWVGRDSVVLCLDTPLVLEQRWA